MKFHKNRVYFFNFINFFFLLLSSTYIAIAVDSNESQEELVELQLKVLVAPRTELERIYESVGNISPNDPLPALPALPAQPTQKVKKRK